MIHNIQQDQKDQAEQIKTLCTFIQPEAFASELQNQTRKSVSTQISDDIQQHTGLSSEELELALKGSIDELEMYTPIDRVN